MRLFALLCLTAVVGCESDRTQVPRERGLGGEGTGAGPEGGGGEGGAGGMPPNHPPLSVEAGFIELPNKTAGSTSRLFYSFRPADQDAANAPLVVFFNGGPGAATSSILLPFGTGPLTLERDGEIGDPLAPNEATFTRFANLLYVDAWAAGFSYDVGSATSCSYEGSLPVGDASDFMYVVLEVLDSHPALTDNPVVLVGESYGGTRAALMTFGFQHYAVPPEGPADAYPDFTVDAPWLGERMQAHLDLAFPDTAGAVLGPDDVARQFGTMVLIQPNLSGGSRFNFATPLLEQDPIFAEHTQSPGVYDPYDVRRTVGEAALVDQRVATAMRDPATLEALLGLPLSAVDGLAASDRRGSNRDFTNYDAAEIAIQEAAMRAALGDLAPNDGYWLPFVTPCGLFLGDGFSLSAFGDVLSRSHTLITNARYDAVVYTPALPLFLDSMSMADIFVDLSDPPGAERPGVIRLVGEPFDATIRFPQYEAGHAVTQSAGRELADDIEAWLVSEGILDR